MGAGSRDSCGGRQLGGGPGQQGELAGQQDAARTPGGHL